MMNVNKENIVFWNCFYGEKEEWSLIFSHSSFFSVMLYILKYKQLGIFKNANGIAAYVLNSFTVN